jgi:hypothetical protein
MRHRGGHMYVYVYQYKRNGIYYSEDEMKPLHASNAMTAELSAGVSLTIYATSSTYHMCFHNDKPRMVPFHVEL